MSRNHYVLQTATDDPAARERANHAPEFSQALSGMGFTLVGIINGLSTDPQFSQSLRLGIAKEDADMMIKLMEEGEAVEVWTSPDQKILAIPERSMTGPVVTMQTILENGVVIETVMKPDRAPRPAGSPSDGCMGMIFGRYLRFFSGPPKIWPRSNWPYSAFFLELVETRDTRALLRRHQERVKEIQAEEKSPIPPLNSLDQYRAIHMRFRRIIEIQSVAGSILIMLLVTLLVLATFLFPLPKTHVEPQAQLMYLCGMVIAFPVLAILGMLGAVAASRWIVPGIPVPLIPLKRLLILQEAIQ